jgi:hypothetical protein
MPKVKGYEDLNYKQDKQIYDSIAQAFQDFKVERNGGHGWNKPVEQLEGVTMRFVSEDKLELTYHRYEVTTVEGLARLDDAGGKFLKEVVKGLKKKFESLTGKTLTLERVHEDRAIDKVSRIQADTSWMLGSSKYGYGARPVGRYLVKDSCVYKFDTDLL